MSTDARPLLLYVEDDADAFKLASRRLSARYRLLWAATDRDACRLFTELHGQLTAVLMDVSLGGSTLDGLDLIRVLRGTHRGPLPAFAARVPASDVPVLVLSAYASLEPDVDAAALGVTRFLPKPIDFARLNLALAQASIRTVLERLQASAP